MRFLFLTILVMSIVSCSLPKGTPRQNVTIPTANLDDPNKCFDIIVLSSQTEETEVLVPIYTGNDISKMQYQELVLCPGYEYFERMKDCSPKYINDNDMFI